jgi:hypothetical protein
LDFLRAIAWSLSVSEAACGSPEVGFSDSKQDREMVVNLDGRGGLMTTVLAVAHDPKNTVFQALLRAPHALSLPVSH